MSHPAYKPPPALCTKAKVAKGGAYLRDTTVNSFIGIVIILLSIHVHAHYVGKDLELLLVEHSLTKWASDRWQQ